jgi:hypothetical protein
MQSQNQDRGSINLLAVQIDAGQRFISYRVEMSALSSRSCECFLTRLRESEACMLFLTSRRMRLAIIRPKIMHNERCIAIGQRNERRAKPKSQCTSVSRCFGRRGIRVLIERDSVLRYNVQRRTVYKCKARQSLTMAQLGTGVSEFRPQDHG